MQFTFVEHFYYNKTKKFAIYKDSDSNLYIEKEVDKERYDTLRIISEVCQASDNLLEIIAFYPNSKSQKKYNYLIPKLEGITLEQQIFKKTPLTKEQFTTIIYQVCQGLKTLHEHNIIHKDVKPANIFILTSGVVKLIDYDIACICNEDGDFKYAGTKGYAAPEQYGFNEVTFATDIYGLGITLQTLLQECCSELHYDFNFLIEKMTDVDNKKRIQNTEELLDLLQNDQLTLFQPQLEQIADAQKLGLSETQISLIAKPYFNSRQMGVLKHALHENIDPQMFTLISNVNFNSRQMFQLKRGAFEGLSYEQVLKFAKEYYTSEEMAIYRTGLLNNLEEVKIHENIKDYQQLIALNHFSDEQLKVIRFCFYSNMDKRDINIIAHQHLSSDKMRRIKDILTESEE